MSKRSPTTVLPVGIEQRLRDRWATAVMVLTWAWLCAPKMIQSVLSPKYRVAAGGEAPYSRVAALADKGLYFALIGLCVLVILVFLTDLPRTGGAALMVMLLPWLYMVVRDLYGSVSLSEVAIIYPLVVMVVWLTRPRFEILAVLGYLVGGTAAISVLLAVVLPSQAIYKSLDGELVAAEKAILPIGVLVGIFTQGNILGQFVCLGLPTVFLIRHVGHRRVLVVLTLVALVWSASRGSLLTAGIGLLTYALVARSSVGVRRAVAWTAPTLVLLVTALVPFLTTDDRSFSNRGLIWIQSLRGWAEQPWTGLGINWYDLLGRSSGRIAGSARHGHNQIIQLLVTGGVVMVCLVALQLVAVMSRAATMTVDRQQFGVVWLTMLAASGLFERTLAYVDNGNFLITVVVPMAVLLLGIGAGTSNRVGATSVPRDSAVGAPSQFLSKRMTTSRVPVHRDVSRNPAATRNAASARASSDG